MPKKKQSLVQKAKKKAYEVTGARDTTQYMMDRIFNMGQLGYKIGKTAAEEQSIPTQALSEFIQNLKEFDEEFTTVRSKKTGKPVIYKTKYRAKVKEQGDLGSMAYKKRKQKLNRGVKISKRRKKKK
jgi:hypothetical protein